MPIDAHVERDGSNLREVRSTPLFDVTGRKTGVVRHVYLDDATDRPDWVGVRTDTFATRLHLVPLEHAEKRYPGIQVPYGRETIRQAPCANRDGRLTASELEALRGYWAGR